MNPNRIFATARGKLFISSDARLLNLESANLVRPIRSACLSFGEHAQRNKSVGEKSYTYIGRKSGRGGDFTFDGVKIPRRACFHWQRPKEQLRQS